MKALIIIRAEESRWLQSYFPDLHPAMVPICNKPLLEFFVDFAVANRCESIRIILEEPGPAVEAWFGRGERFGVEISYSDIMLNDSVDTLLAKNRAFCDQSSLMIFDGFFFIHYNKQGRDVPWQQNTDSGLLSSCPGGMVLYARDEHCQKNISAGSTSVDFALSSLQSIDDLFQLSMQILAAEPDHYVLPGYSEDKLIFIGRNVEMGEQVSLVGPLMLGDHVRLCDKTVIGPGAIIGSGSIIDRGTEIVRSLVIGSSYIGRNLTLKEKIVQGEQLISPLDGTCQNIRDHFLVSDISEETSFQLISRASNSFLALLLGTVQFTPYLVLWLLCHLQRDWQQEQRSCLLNRKGRSAQLLLVRNPRGSLSGQLFRALSLHKFPLLWAVIRGRLKLVGNRLLEDTDRNRQLLADFQSYRPGVFAYSEVENLASESLEAEVAERFYAAGRGPWHDSKIFIRLLVARLTGRINQENQDAY